MSHELYNNVNSSLDPKDTRVVGRASEGEACKITIRESKSNVTVKADVQHNLNLFTKEAVLGKAEQGEIMAMIQLIIRSLQVMKREEDLKPQKTFGEETLIAQKFKEENGSRITQSKKVKLLKHNNQSTNAHEEAIWSVKRKYARHQCPTNDKNS